MASKTIRFDCGYQEAPHRKTRAKVNVVVLAAVRQDWRALEYGSEEVRGDREVVLAAVKQDR